MALTVQSTYPLDTRFHSSVAGSMSQAAKDTFQFCPRCGEAAAAVGANPFRCHACQYTLYFAPTVAVGGIVTNAMGQVLLIRRARDPGRGKFGLPGGFVDAGETAEQAVAREIREEVGLQAMDLRYLASYENSYDYQGIVSPVLDIFFVCEVASIGALKPDRDEVSDYLFCLPSDRELSNMAFESNRRALITYLQSHRDAHDAHA